MKTPECIGIIMDGNRRWAKEKNLPFLEGHRAGKEKLKEVMSWVKEAGIAHLIIYAFSNENWNRKEEEVNYLMDIIRFVFKNELTELKEKGLRIRFVGEKSRFSKDIRDILDNVEKETSQFTEHTLWVALSYGGRSEILQAVNTIIDSKIPGPITGEIFEKHLFTSGMPDPDIIVRTSGEKRLSGFLPWQGVYSELFFIDTYWPAFSKEEFDEILSEYDRRERRFGA